MSILVLTSDTLIGTAATGNIEYNGQFFGTDSAASRAQMQRITLGTPVASTSGTSIDFTSIPAWVKRITVMYIGVTTSGASLPQVRVGTSAGVISTGYLSTASRSTLSTSSTTGFTLVDTNSTLNGLVVLVNSGNFWVNSSNISLQSNSSATGAGYVTFSGTLDRIRLTTVNGTDTFTAGSINILYEG